MSTNGTPTQPEDPVRLDTTTRFILSRIALRTGVTPSDAVYHAVRLYHAVSLLRPGGTLRIVLRDPDPIVLRRLTADGVDPTRKGSSVGQVIGFLAVALAAVLLSVALVGGAVALTVANLR